jgi:hypothetical protein
LEEELKSYQAYMKTTVMQYKRKIEGLKAQMANPSGVKAPNSAPSQAPSQVPSQAPSQAPSKSSSPNNIDPTPTDIVKNINNDLKDVSTLSESAKQIKFPAIER